MGSVGSSRSTGSGQSSEGNTAAAKVQQNLDQNINQVCALYSYSIIKIDILQV